MKIQKKDGSLKLSSKKTWKNYYDEEIKYLKESEIISVFGSINNEFHKMLFQFLFETGGRISEVLQVKFSDIDFKYNKVRLLTLKRQNKKGTRVLTISNSLINKILLYEKKKSFKNFDYLFSKKSGCKFISIQAANKAVKKSILNCLGENYFELAHPHTLRHSRAIQLLNSGVNIIHVKSILGHANIMNTLIYLKYSNKDLQESIIKANSSIGLS
jgi:integrase